MNTDRCQENLCSTLIIASRYSLLQVDLKRFSITIDLIVGYHHTECYSPRSIFDWILIARQIDYGLPIISDALSD